MCVNGEKVHGIIWNKSCSHLNSDSCDSLYQPSTFWNSEQYSGVDVCLVVVVNYWSALGHRALREYHTYICVLLIKIQCTSFNMPNKYLTNRIAMLSSYQNTKICCWKAPHIYMAYTSSKSWGQFPFPKLKLAYFAQKK